MKTKRRGFTLIELLISTTLLAFALFAALVFFQNQQIGSLDGDAQVIVSRLKDAQTRAVAGVGGNSWGIYFNNATSSPFYALFQGSSYVSPSSTYFLSGLVQFQNPTSSATSSILFNKLTGTLSASTSVSIQLKNNTSQARTISVTSQGIITYQ